MDYNRSSSWVLNDGDYLNHDLDYELGHKLIKRRKIRRNIIYILGFGSFTFTLMLIVLHAVANIRY